MNTAANSNPYFNLTIEPEMRAQDLARDLLALADNIENMGTADIWDQVSSLANSALILCQSMGIDPETITEPTED